MGGLGLYLNFSSGWISKADILKFDGSFKFVLFDTFFWWTVYINRLK